MSKTQTPVVLPVFGKPLFVISANNFPDKLKGKRAKTLMSTIRYFAVDAVLVKAVEYLDDTMTGYLINKDTDVEMKIHQDDVHPQGNKVFFNKDEADALAVEMNLAQKEECHEIANEAMNAYHEFDEIILAHTAE